VLDEVRRADPAAARAFEAALAAPVAIRPDGTLGDGEGAIVLPFDRI
jgi:hypothetical protein